MSETFPDFCCVSGFNASYASFESAITSLVNLQPSFGSLINDYIYRQFLFSAHAKKDDISENEYWTYIKHSFENNGLKGCGSLETPCTTRLDKKRPILQKSIDSIQRDDIFLFAFGLGMDTDKVTELLTDYIFQYDFNPKNYVEVIYYWCLKNRSGISGVRQWMEFYNITECNYSRDICKNTGTTLLFSDLKHINNEFDFKNFLCSLKCSSDCDKKLRSPKLEFENLVTDLPRFTSYKPKKTGKVNITYLVESLAKFRMAATALNADRTLKHDILQKIFANICISERVIRNRINGTVPVSRKELLFMYFITNTITYSNIQDNPLECETDINKRVREFKAGVNYLMENCRMCNLTLASPFDFFLYFCLMHKDPLIYFLDSWNKSLQ